MPAPQQACPHCYGLFGSSSIAIHMRRCRDRPKRLRAVVPATPEAADPVAALEAFLAEGLLPCKHCGRRFFANRLPLHERVCHAVRWCPAKANAPVNVPGTTVRMCEWHTNWRSKRTKFLQAVHSMRRSESSLHTHRPAAPPPHSGTSSTPRHTPVRLADRNMPCLALHRKANRWRPTSRMGLLHDIAIVSPATADADSRRREALVRSLQMERDANWWAPRERTSRSSAAKRHAATWQLQADALLRQGGRSPSFPPSRDRASPHGTTSRVTLPLEQRAIAESLAATKSRAIGLLTQSEFSTRCATSPLHAGRCTSSASAYGAFYQPSHTGRTPPLPVHGWHGYGGRAAGKTAPRLVPCQPG